MRREIISFMALVILLLPATAAEPPVSMIEVCEGESCAAAGESVNLIACEVATFRAAMFDKNNAYEWSVGNEKRGTGSVFSYTSDKPREERVWLDVKNPYGEDISSVRVLVAENERPILESVYVKRLDSGDEETYYSGYTGEKISLIVGVNNTLIIRRQYSSSDDDLTPKVVVDNGDVAFNSTCAGFECGTSFRFLDEGNFTITIRDVDRCGQNHPTEIYVEVIENELPTADITGEFFTKEGQTIQLSGAQSDFGGDKGDKITEFCWRFVPFGKEARLYDWQCSESSEISVPNEYDLYEAFLLVKDLYGGTNQTSEIVGFERAYNRPPRCNQAPPQTINLFETATLDGSNCKDDHRIVWYEWNIYLISPEGGKKLVGNINTTSRTTKFSRFNWTGTYVIELKVTDDGDLPSEYGDTSPLTSTSTMEVRVVGSEIMETRPPTPTPTAISTVKKEESRPTVSITAAHKAKPPSGPPGLTNQEIVVGFIFAIIVIAILYRWNERRKKRLGRK